MRLTPLLGATAVLALVAGAASGATLDDVKAKGYLQCGVSTGLAGFSFTDKDGNWHGFDVAFCRAVAAAIFGDPSKVHFTPLSPKVRFTALSSGEVDMLARNTTWTFTRDVELKFTFTGINYYDGQGFMVPKKLNVTSAKQLDGATICIQTGTTTELNLSDYFRVNNMKYEAVPIETDAQAVEKFLSGACDVYTTDASGLAAVRATFDNPKDYVILPEIVSKEPLGPLVRQGDDEWGDIVRWTENALVEAEEKGVTQANVSEKASKPTDDPEVNRMLGTEGDLGAKFRLSKDWAVQAIKAEGNYGEIFAKYLGPNTPISLERGLNALWTKGGLQYSPPWH